MVTLSLRLTPEEIASLEEPYAPHPVLGFVEELSQSPNSPVEGEAEVTADIHSQLIDLLVKLPPGEKSHEVIV